MTKTQKSLVLFSGGQDSCVCLAYALEHYGQVETIGFSYGQSHKVELETRTVFLQKFRKTFPNLSAKLGQDHQVDLTGFGGVAKSSLTSSAAITRRQDGLPDSYVPGRNLIFLITAAALADRRHAEVLVGGMCETDYSGYPDCRREALDAVEQTILLGMGLKISIDTPLMKLTKSQTWKMAFDLGGQKLVDLIIKDSHSCYQGDRSHLHEWGYGCGHCDACQLRAKGYSTWVKTR